ncbi:MAG TPA: hypothetical protein VMU98_01895 [Acidimicrobiales bacterium]|nr:hypothetical protein [Acidimicrobiales bacterium]
MTRRANGSTFFRSRSALLGSALLVTALLSVCLASESFGSTPTTSSPSSAAGYLCRVISRIDGLIVYRHAPGSKSHFSFPEIVTAPSATSAQLVAAAACRLPVLPGGVHCPAGFAISYSLNFAVRGEKGMGGETLRLNPTGCQTIIGLGGTGLKAIRWLALDQGFYRVLGDAISMNHAGRFTFVGSS